MKKKKKKKKKKKIKFFNIDKLYLSLIILFNKLIKIIFFINVFYF